MPPLCPEYVPIGHGSTPEKAPLGEQDRQLCKGFARTAVILAAGEGSRMAGVRVVPKPLLELDGIPLIERAILGLARAGVLHFRVVVGDNAEVMERALRARPRLRQLDITLVRCRDARLGNGHSLAAGAAGLDQPFILSMSDHVFDPRIPMWLQAQAVKDRDRVHLATDAAIDDVFDLDDATKVAVEGEAIRELGKTLESYSRVDVGLFYCPGWLGKAAVDAVSAGAHSVSDVMHLAIERDALRSCAIEPLFWQDVDTPQMLREARRRLRINGDPLAGTAPRVRRWLERGALALGLGLVGWMLSRQPFSELSAAAATLPAWVVGVLVFPLLWYTCNTLGLWTLLGRRVGLRPLLFNRVAGEGLNALLPLAGFGGEPFKARHLARWLPEQEAVTFVIGSRIVEELSGLIFAGACLLVGAATLHRSSGLFLALGVLLVTAGVGGALLLTSHLPGRLAVRLMRLLKRPAVVPPRLAAPQVLGALAFHLSGRLFGFLEVTFLLGALDVNVSLQAAAAVTGLLLVSGVAAVIFPQGLGVLEVASVFALGLLGQPAALGVTFGLLRRARMLIFGAVGSALGLLELRAPARGTPDLQAT
jgi:1L-myo-inositol 1-phosphate cytidylyltransferase